MKNRTPIKTNHNVYLKEIIDSKEPPRKDILTNNNGFLLTKFKEYRAAFNKNELESLKETAHAEDLAEALKHCYGVPTNALDALKLAIKAKQGLALQGICPYCTIRVPDETDHYVGEEEFPEFAVLALNLIPCCSTCNKKKGQWWRVADKRQFINFYSDIIPDEEFLKVKVNFIRQDKALIPVAEFSLNFSAAVANNVKELIQSHYKRLNLLKSFSDAVANGYIALRTSLTQMKNTDEKILAEYLKNYAAQTSINRGPNYWEAAYVRALSQEKKFLKYIVKCSV